MPTKNFSVHLLDVGKQKYGDAILCRFGKISVLIDGAHPPNWRREGKHPSIHEQLDKFLGTKQTHEVSLLIISHAHQDHIGCLPKLVRDGVVRAERVLLVHPDLAFPAAATDAIDAASDAARGVARALREEPLPPDTDRATLDQFLSDAANLEDDYREMIATLRKTGKVVQYRGRPSDVSAIEKPFASIGLKLLGPSSKQLRACADAMVGATHDAVRASADATRDSPLDAVDLYQRLIAIDSLDASRAGAAVNLQSLVTRFRYGGRKLLFSGDLQFVSGASDDTIETETAKLLAAVKKDGPYDFVKVGHHGSENAFDQAVMDALGGAKDFGICAGEDSTAHPNRSVLDMLDAAAGVKWARTDRNGQSTFSYTSAKRPTISVTEGNDSDPQPNSDQVTEVAVGAGAPQRIEAGSSVVEVTTTMSGARTTVTVDVKPRTPVSPPRPGDLVSGPLPTLRVGAGRDLRALLVLTSRDALADNIGVLQAQHALGAVRAAGLAVIDDLPRGTDDPGGAAGRVRDYARRNPGIRGVILLGGYDVVPSQRVDCLPPDVRSKNTPNDDPDDFVVWSDDVYGELGGDPLPELPVSRIPDGHDARVVFAALSASGPAARAPHGGIRNVMRPFADIVYRGIAGRGAKLLSSKPTMFDDRPPYDLAAERVYLMLHGDYVDGRRFRGEDGDERPVAMDVTNVPEQSGVVALAGCCWGALPVDQPAGRLGVNEKVIAHKGADGSIALTFLLRGARAFVGCTGAHYSPDVRPYGFYGQPMHEAFWRNYGAGKPPAEALLGAKREYAGGMPHGRNTPGSLAIEFKILRTFTCLGLGW